MMYLSSGSLDMMPQTMDLEQMPGAYLSSVAPAAWIQPAQMVPEQAEQHLEGCCSKGRCCCSKAAALSQVEVDSHAQVAEMVEDVKTILARSPKIASADLAQSSDGWFLVVAPTKGNTVTGDHVLALAKRALHEAAEKSKSVYVLGYKNPEFAFTTKAQGFEAKLAVMGIIQRACLCTFKQGTCQQGWTCRKDHPVIQVPVRVFLDAAQFQVTATEPVIQYCKQEFANFLMMVIHMLANNSGVAVTLHDEGGEGWSLEIPVIAEHSNFREHFLTLAQSAFLEASRQSKNIFVMGDGADPFIPTPNGFAAMLGEMTDQSQACWDVYKDGICSREGGCRWQHPQVLMPVRLVLKATEFPAMQE